MARTTRPLTNIEVLRAKALEKDLTLHDGDGLFLIVITSGKSSGVSVINVQRQNSGQ
ncbi:Prophage CP4-57 integrase [Citrobacter cronae]